MDHGGRSLCYRGFQAQPAPCCVEWQKLPRGRGSRSKGGGLPHMELHTSNPIEHGASDRECQAHSLVETLAASLWVGGVMETSHPWPKGRGHLPSLSPSALPRVRLWCWARSWTHEGLSVWGRLHCWHFRQWWLRNPDRRLPPKPQLPWSPRRDRIHTGSPQALSRDALYMCILLPSSLSKKSTGVHSLKGWLNKYCNPKI